MKVCHECAARGNREDCETCGGLGLVEIGDAPNLRAMIAAAEMEIAALEDETERLRNTRNRLQSYLNILEQIEREAK